jgi:hypothetical protein
MPRIVAAIGIVLLLTSPSLAQSYCQQVRQAVARYGYVAAKRHAMTAATAKRVFWRTQRARESQDVCQIVAIAGRAENIPMPSVHRSSKPTWSSPGWMSFHTPWPAFR